MTTNLADALQIKPPAKLEEAPPVMSLERRREVPIPWADLLDQVFGDHYPGNASIRQYFEKSWRVDGWVEGIEDHLTIVAAGPEDNATAVTPAFYQANSATLESPLPAGSGILSDGHGRHFVLSLTNGFQLIPGVMQNPLFYEHFWEHVIAAHVCAPTPDEAGAAATTITVIDLEQLQLLSAYDNLRAQESFDDDLQAAVMDRTVPLIHSALDVGLDIESINRVEQAIVRVKLRSAAIQRRLQRIAARAAALGLELFLTEEAAAAALPAKWPDDTDRGVPLVGTLYERYVTEYEWTSSITKTVPLTGWQRFGNAMGSLIGMAPAEPEDDVVITEDHARDVEDLKIVTPDANSLTKALETARLDGRSIFLFERTPQGYVATDGTSIEEVMFRCLRDESFRRSCTLFLPVFDDDIAGAATISGYNAISAPFPGIVPNRFPRLFLLEDLSYRMAWTGTRLGEVVSSLNLAPGESRQVTISRSTESEERLSVSSMRLAEDSMSETSQFESELAKTIGADQSMGVKLSGSFTEGAGVKTKEASAERTKKVDGSYDVSVRHFSNRVARTAQQTARATNASRRDEVSTDSMSSTHTMNESSYVAQISNVNEGRTLNLLFHRLFNTFDTGIFLDDLRVEVESGVELVAGTGIYPQATYRLDNLAGALAAFSSAELPLPIDRSLESVYLRQGLELLEALIEAEYARVESPTSAGGLAAPLAASSVQALELPAAEPAASTAMTDNALAAYAAAAQDAAQTRSAALAGSDNGPLPGLLTSASSVDDEAATSLREAADADLAAALTRIQDRLNQVGVVDRLINEQQIELVSPGLYLDALVGAIPSTEHYSERMRDQAVALEAARVDKKLAQAKLIDAKADAHRAQTDTSGS